MQRPTLPPPHPSLPQHPVTQTQTPVSAYQSASAYPAYYNSHYVQAYAQPAPTHETNLNSNSNYASQSISSRNRNGGHGPSTPQYTMSSWYQSGNNRCVHSGCTFTGSHKTVELHMMDRHLIYPPDWDKRKKKNDWDADPSLKGKPIPIQGTNVILDSPDVLKAWIAERKRRFPTSSRVEEKKRKMSEAVARGQLDLTDTGARANKRQKTDNQDRYGASKEKHTRLANGPGKDFEHFRVPDSGWGARSKGKEIEIEVTTRPPSLHPEHDGDDNDDQPEAISSKITPQISLPCAPLEPETRCIVDPLAPSTATTDLKSRTKTQSQPPQPKLPARNPFASRPTLLRNLLLPEIRITISNLSQAIRFLVDNKFLQDVELKPGQTLEENSIQVVKHEGALDESSKPLSVVDN